MSKIYPPQPPLPPRESIYGVKPEYIGKRAYQLPGMVFVKIKDLFPDMPEVIWPPPNTKAIREATVKALESIDMSYIKPEHSVNILASHHGFTLLGGEPYAEMLKTIRDVVEERTKCRDIRLRAGVGLRFRETEEYIRKFKLDEYFGSGKAIGITPIDPGIPIETEIGTLYGIRAAYDADWIIHAHNSDVREVHFHRHVDRAVKPFGMSYARIETRSAYHHNLGPRGANFIARAIFESPLVKRKWAFACFLLPTPVGIVGVDADRDLYRLDERITRLNLKTYGKVMHLLGKIDEAIAILDFMCPVPYVFAGGVIFANFCCANIDLFDLDKPFPPYTWYTEAYYDENEKPLSPEIPPPNPAIKAIVINYVWKGYPSVFWSKHFPTIIVGEHHKELFDNDPQNIEFTKYIKAVTPDLDSAIKLAYEIAKTDKIIVFDGAAGGFNVSKSLAELLIKEATKASKEVDEELIHKWLRQRGIKP
ncbi:MAG: hypothetical protein QXY40_03445 [Candidatus Methanomethylicia archaeon]